MRRKTTDARVMQNRWHERHNRKATMLMEMEMYRWMMGYPVNGNAFFFNLTSWCTKILHADSDAFFSPKAKHTLDFFFFFIDFGVNICKSQRRIYFLHQNVKTKITGITKAFAYTLRWFLIIERLRWIIGLYVRKNFRIIAGSRWTSLPVRSMFWKVVGKKKNHCAVEAEWRDSNELFTVQNQSGHTS